MPDWLKALIAGYGAKKLGGGCLSTIFIFIVIYYALGQCNRPVVRHGSLYKPANSRAVTAGTIQAGEALPVVRRSATNN